MHAVYKELDGQDQVLRACKGINSSGRVVKTVVPGSRFLFQEDVDVKRVNECIMCLEDLISDWLVSCICAMRLKRVKVVRSKTCFWDKVLNVT